MIELLRISGRTCLSTGQTDKNMLGPLESARGPKGPGSHHWWSSRTHALGGLAIEPLALYRPKQGIRDNPVEQSNGTSEDF